MSSDENCQENGSEDCGRLQRGGQRLDARGDG